MDKNLMRHDYRALSEDEKNRMRLFKDIGLQFVTLCAETGSSRELALAATKMEEAVMWAVKHVTG